MDSYRINPEFKVIFKNDKEALKQLDNIYIKLNEARKVIIDGFLNLTRIQEKKEKKRVEKWNL